MWFSAALAVALTSFTMELSYAIFPAGLGFTRGSRNAWGWGCRCHRRFSPAGGAIAIACVAWHLGPQIFAWNHVFFWWKFIEGFFIILLFCYIFWMCFKTTFVRIDSQIAFASLFRWHLKKWNITFVSDGCCKGDPYADSMGFSALHWIPQFLPWNLFTKKPATFFIKFEVLTGSSWLKLHFLPVAYFFDCHMVVSCKFLFLSKIEGWIIVWLRFFEALLWSSSMARSSTICKKTGGFFHDEMDFFLSPPAVGFQLAMKSVGVRWGYIHGDGLGKKALLVLPVMTQYNVAWLILESSKELKLVKWGSFACTVAELCNGSTIVVGSCCNNKNQLLETWKGSRTFFSPPADSFIIHAQPYFWVKKSTVGVWKPPFSCQDTPLRGIWSDFDGDPRGIESRGWVIGDRAGSAKLDAEWYLVCYS